mmetsp:Transcript_168255/g.540557  ORF Transcript_168255/g.540557 Transcript_168255/m.540557 type:complete len:340 (+) Transcript_168255:93-1112(+)
MFTCLQINLWSRLPCIHLGQQFSQHHGRLCGVVHPERAASPAREEVVAGARELVADVKSLGSLGANKTAKHVNANLLGADVDEDIRTPVESAEGQLAWPARLHALDGRPGQQRELVEEEGRGAALGAREVHAHGTSLSDQHCLVLYAKPPCSIDECLLGNIQDLRHLSGTPLFHHVRLPSLSFESDETARVFTIPEDIVALPSDGVERGPGSDERLARQRAQQSPKPLLKRPRAGVADSSAERHRYPTLKKLHLAANNAISSLAVTSMNVSTSAAGPIPSRSPTSSAQRSGYSVPSPSKVTSRGPAFVVARIWAMFTMFRTSLNCGSTICRAETCVAAS